MRRFALAALLLTALPPIPTALAAVTVEQTDEEITLANAHCAVTLEVARGAGAMTALRLAQHDQVLLSRAALALYFRENDHWVDETWIRATDIQVRDVPGGKAVQVEVADFGGFALRKAVTLRDDSAAVQVSYHMAATREVRPLLIVPLSAGLSVEMDRLATPGGEVAAADLQVSDFAMESPAPWHAFRSAAERRGVVIAPIRLPDMHRVQWIGRKPDDRLTLAVRLHPMRTFAPGDEVSFAYNLLPFTGEPAEAARVALEAGAGPLEPVARPAVAAAPDEARELARGLRVVHAPRFAQAPEIDGRLDDPAWQEAGVLERFVSLDARAFPEAQTTAYVGHDDEHLYVAVRCVEPLMDQVRTDARPGSGQVWTDDCVELFINPDPTGREYAQFIINAAGVLQDNLPGERAVAYGRRAAAARGEGEWTVEAVIPFGDLDAEPPAAGDIWRLNVCRSRVAGRENSAWSPTLRSSDYHVPERFGILVFGGPEVRVTRIHTGLEGPERERALEVSLANAAPEARAVTGEFAVSRNGTETDRGALEGAAPAGGAATLEAPYETPRPGTYRLALSLRDEAGPILDGALAAPVRGPGLNSALYPAEEDDNRLYVAKGTAQHFFFVPANHSERTHETFRFVLTLPEGIEVMQASGDRVPYYHRPTLQARTPEERDGRRMVRWVWESDRGLGPRELGKVRFYSTWCGALLPDEGLAEGPHRFYFHLEAEDEQEPEHVGELVVLPEPRGVQPRDIVVGMCTWTLSPTPEFWRRLVDNYRKCGINLLDSSLLRAGEEWAAPAREAGMRPWQLVWWFWWNDAYIAAHPDHAAVKSDGTPEEKIICPEIMASDETDAIAGLMQPLVEATQAGLLEGLWWDLEGPAAFSVCFCERCLAAFREFAGIPAEEELTPLGIQARHGEAWVDFACRQSARIAGRMQSYSRAAGGGPKIAVYSGTQSEHTRRAYRVDWPTLAPEIDVATPSFYSFSAAALSTTFTTGIRDFVALVRGVRDIPVWATLSTGYERGSHFTTDGRLTRMQIIKSVAYGADGTYQWWWGPVDGRHYHAYAEATALIAELEEFFTEGVEAPDFLDGEEPGGTTRIARRLGESVLVMLFNDSPTQPVTMTARTPEGFRLARSDGEPEMTFAGGVLTAAVAPLDCRWAVLEGGRQ